jgi:hypothetical protein
MIVINTKKCPIHFKSEVGWDKIDEGVDFRYERMPERDLFEIGYKGSKITLRPYFKSIDIEGDTVMAALGFAFLIRDTNRNIPQAFTFSEDGHIEKLNWPTSEVIETFIKEYNRIFNTVLLLG